MAINLTNPYLTNSYSLLQGLTTPGSTKLPVLEGTENDAQATFSGLLAQAMNSTVSTDAASKLTDLNLMTGQSDDIHSITIAGEKASLMLNLTVQIRNRMVEGYQEIMRMQI